MIILDNIRQMLIKGDKDIAVISQDIKKQLNLLEQILKSN
jgi:hypothetical protein